jgi:hypothetical protein
MHHDAYRVTGHAQTDFHFWADCHEIDMAFEPFYEIVPNCQPIPTARRKAEALADHNVRSYEFLQLI